VAQQPLSDIPTRRTSVTESVAGDGFSFAVTVGFHPTYGSPLEVFLTQRGKTGSPLETTLYEIGVTASKMMQDYDTSGSRIQALEEALTQQREENVRLGRLLQGKNVREEIE
tara:strand:+ start:500 stop:835 length:336 start_codon:yes stop_codon:yes gene_type:complete